MFRNCGLGKRGSPYRVSDGAYSRSSIYKRGEPLVSHCTSSGTAEASFLDPKIAPHTLSRAPPIHLPAPLAPQFPGFPPLFLKIFKKFFAQLANPCPPCAESPRRTPNQAKNPGIPRQNRPSAPHRRPDFTRKMPLRNPKKPAPYAPPRKKVE